LLELVEIIRPTRRNIVEERRIKLKFDYRCFSEDKPEISLSAAKENESQMK